jgi:hypothetical protein
MEVALDDIVVSVATQREKDAFLELALELCQELKLWNISRTEYNKQLGDDITLYCIWVKRGERVLALANTHGPKLFCVGFVPGMIYIILSSFPSFLPSITLLSDS